jgi:lipopolysaccharide export system permease protein
LILEEAGRSGLFARAAGRASRTAGVSAPPKPLLNLLQRYLFRELLGTTLAAVSLFAFVLITGNAIKDLVARLADGVLSLETALRLMAMLLPFVLTYALPMGVLTAVLLTLGRVSASNEITALRSAGIGLSRIGAPAVFLGVLGVAASLAVNFVYAPRLRGQYREILAEAGQKNPLALIVERAFIRDFPRVVIYVSERRRGLLSDVWVWELGDDRVVRRFVHGKEASVRWDEESNILGIDLRGVRVQEAPSDVNRPPETLTSDTLAIEVALDRVFKRKAFERKLDWLDIREMLAERRRLQAGSEPADRARLARLEMMLHENGALACSVLAFAAVGVPLGIRTRRKETSANLGIALAMTMAYYFLMISAGWLAKYPQFHPEVLLWLPNAVFLALGGWMWWRFGRN